MPIQEWINITTIVELLWVVATASLLAVGFYASCQKRHDATERKRRFQLAVSQIFWLAFVNGLFLYTVVGGGFWPFFKQAVPGSPDRLLLVIFSAMGVSSTVVLFKWPKWHKLSPLPQSYLGYSNTQFALAESIGIFGFLLFLQSSSWSAYLPFLVWSAILLWLVRPTKEGQQKFLAAKDS